MLSSTSSTWYCPRTSRHLRTRFGILASRWESTDHWARDYADLSYVFSCAMLVVGFCSSRSRLWMIVHSSSMRFRSGLFPGHSSFAQKLGRLSRHHCWAVAERCAGAPSCTKMAFGLSDTIRRFRTEPSLRSADCR